MSRILAWISGLFVSLLSAMVFAQTTQAQVMPQEGSWIGEKAALAIGASLAIALAAAGGGIGQGLASSKAMEGISRNPEAASKVMTPMIIALALIESLVIYALVIAFLLQGKI